MALCGCGDGGNPKLAMMDACNYVRAQESATIRSGEPRTKCCTTWRQIGGRLVLSGFEKPPIYQSCLIEISMVTHHFPDSGREWDRGRRVSRCGELIDIGSRMCTRIDWWVRMDARSTPRPIRCISSDALCSVIPRFSGASYENLIRRQQRRWCSEHRRLSLKYRCSHREIGKSLRFDHKMRCDEIFYD